MPLITIRNLGTIGRIGNSLFLYCFARGYALAHGCELQIPADWWGRKVFKDADPFSPITKGLPQTERDDVTKRPLNRWFGRTDIDLNVFAQHQIYLDYYSRKQVREWLTFKPEWERLNAHTQAWEKSGCSKPGCGYPDGKPCIGCGLVIHPYTVAHKRRGDYTQEFSKYYCTVSDNSYAIAIDQFNIPWQGVTVYDGWREAPKVLPPELSWLQDFLLMRDAAHLLRANSTFSWWAATLGHGNVYSPLVRDWTGLQDVPFVEGNWPTTAGKFKNQSDLRLKEE